MKDKGIYFAEIKVNNLFFNECVTIESIYKKIEYILENNFKKVDRKNIKIEVKILKNMGYANKI
jgi:hypothetical protein